MTQCRICSIDYKNSGNIVGTFPEYISFGNDQGKMFIFEFCTNCLPLASGLHCSNCKMRWRLESIESFKGSHPSERKYYCKNCTQLVWSERTKDFQKEFEELKISKESLEKQLAIERSTFEEALQTAEEWHKEQLALKEEEIAKLKLLLEDQNLKSLLLRIETLENTIQN